MRSESLALVRKLGVCFVVIAAGCGVRSGLRFPTGDASIDIARDAAICVGAAPRCVAPSDDPCGAPSLVPARCEPSSLAWQCPSGTRVYVRATDAATSCLPFRASGSPIRALDTSLVRVPTDDGRCVWIAEQLTLTSGEELRNVAIVPDPNAAFGSCPTQPAFLGGRAQSVVVVQGPSDPLAIVQITGGYRLAGASRVTYRLFRADGGPAFGLTELGTGLARWDQGHIVIPSASVVSFGTDLDLGDASWSNGAYGYIWGCPGPPNFLTERCVLARLDARDNMELFVGAGRWTTTRRGLDGAQVFDAGPWVSSVVPGPNGRLTHMYAVGFGSDLQVHRASAPQGPWSAGVSVARCALPADDPMAYCAGPVVQSTLADPTRPTELPVTYGVGTTDMAMNARASSRPEAFWPRLVWVTVP